MRLLALFWAALGVAVAAAVMACVVSGRWPLSFIFVTVAAIWFLGQRQGWPTATAGFTGYVLALALAGALEVGAGWLLLSMVAALAAWDLNMFHGRLAGAARVEGAALLVQAHLRQLAIAIGLGLLLSGGALLVQFSLSFGLALFLVAVAVVGLSLAIWGWK